MSIAQLHSNAPLTREELTAITALVEYLEFTCKKTRSYDRLAAEFDVTDIKQIKRRDYDRAVVFLVDLQVTRVN